MNEKLNSIDIRANNARRIIYELRNSPPMTKKDLSDRLELSLPTITNIGRILESEGYIEECGSVKAAVGRKPALITISRDSRYAVGLHVDTHFFTAAVLNFGGDILLQEHIPLPFAGTEEYWSALSRHTDGMVERLGLDRQRVLGVRLAISHLLLPDTEDLLDPASIPEHLLGGEEIARAFSLPMSLIIPSEAAGTARYWYKRDVNNSLVLLLNRYIEGCLITQDPLSHLPRSRPIPLGHISLNPRGKRCFCGRRGCLQTLCSPSVITDRINGLDTASAVVVHTPERKLLHWKDFLEEMEAGNAAYRALFDEYMDDLACAVLNFRLLFNADIVIAGENAPVVTRYREELVRRLLEPSDRWSREQVEQFLHTSSLPRYEACVGAALSVFDSALAAL